MQINKITTLKELKNDPYLLDIYDFLFLTDDWPNDVYEFTIEHISDMWRADFDKIFKELSSLNKQGFIHKIYLDNNNKDPKVLYLEKKHSNKLAVILPGGGYWCACSYEEGYPIGLEMYKNGYNVFILSYRTKIQAPAQLDDIAKLYKYIIKHYPTFNINDSILFGSSAGGHLAASWCTKSVGYIHYDLPCVNKLCLLYPVVTMKKYTHQGTRETLLGKNPSEELLNKYSIEENIDKDFPNTYFWHSLEDSDVSIENAKLLDNALTKANVPHKLQLYPGSLHGAGLANNCPAEGWFIDMKNYFKI